MGKICSIADGKTKTVLAFFLMVAINQIFPLCGTLFVPRVPAKVKNIVFV
jgi:hypothetical protein